MKCSPQSKLTSEELENAVAKLRVPLNRLHLDETGVVAVGPERKIRNGHRFLTDLIQTNDSGCWLWIGGRSSERYGRMSIERQLIGAHRIIFSIFFGLTSDQLVLHECDNPPCVCPFHLFAGTHTDNMRDMQAKGRGNAAHGEKAAMSKLCEADVRAIRALVEGRTLSMRQIAKAYSITHHTVRHIASGKTWKHVTT